MYNTRILTCALLVFLTLACRDLSNTPTDVGTEGPKIPPSNPVIEAGQIDVTLTSLSDDLVRLAWFDTDSTRSSYTVERKDSDTSQFVVLAALPPSCREYSDGGIKQILRTYYYRVSAVKGSSERVYSNTLPMYLNPRRPMAFQAIHISPRTLMLQWNFTGNVSSGFLIQRSLEGIAYSPRGTASRGAFEFIDEDLDTSQVYFYRAFTLTEHSMGPSSAQLKVGYAYDPLYASYRWTGSLFERPDRQPPY